MVNTQISHLGSRKIALSGLGEIKIPALANGTSKSGELVGITDATGRTVGCDVGASEMFRGIQDDEPSTADNVAPIAGTPISIIVPQTGHIYRIWCKDPSGAVVSGLQHKMSDTSGNIDGAANTNINTAGNLCTNTQALASGDLVMEADWL